jgi:small subunit ribosomal protein S1
MNQTDDQTTGEFFGGVSHHPMDFLLTDEFKLGIPEPGEVRQGQIVAYRNNEILVDIGAKSEGIIPSREVETLDGQTRQQLAVGNEVPVYVVDPEDKDGNVILSYIKAVEEQDWLTAQELLANQEAYHGKVIGYNRGGLLIKMGQVRGFVPASQLSLNRQMSNVGETTEEQLRKIVGQKIYAKVIEVDRERNRLILSERAATKELRESQRVHLLDNLKEGEVREGRIVNLADFGAFVDIGGIEGLVHLSELSWKRVNHPAEKLKLGDQVKVYVLNVDLERQRVALSLKRLEADPWNNMEAQYQAGQLVEATITKITKYGAFARINDEYELEGLIHISELSAEHVKHPRDMVQKGDVVTARIIRIDPEQRQLGLSIKRASSEDFMAEDLALAENYEDEEVSSREL